MAELAASYMFYIFPSFSFPVFVVLVYGCQRNAQSTSGLKQFVEQQTLFSATSCIGILYFEYFPLLHVLVFCARLLFQ